MRLNNIILFFSVIIFNFSLFANEEIKIVETINAEFQALKGLVKDLKADYKIGFLNAKDYPNKVTLLWKISDEEEEHELIRIYQERDNKEDFEVVFHKNTYIGEGKMVLRRFVGGTRTNWRNDSILVSSQEYLGSQGVIKITTDHESLVLLKDWSITLF